MAAKGKFRAGVLRLDVALPPSLATEFLETVARRIKTSGPIAVAVRQAIEEWCARPDQLVPADRPVEIANEDLAPPLDLGQFEDLPPGYLEEPP